MYISNTKIAWFDWLVSPGNSNVWVKLIQPTPDPCFPLARWSWAWFGELVTYSWLLIGSPKTWFLWTCPVVKLHKHGAKNLHGLWSGYKRNWSLHEESHCFSAPIHAWRNWYQFETARGVIFLWFGFRMMKFRFRRQGNDPHREKIKQDLFAFNKVCGIHSVGSPLSLSLEHACGFGSHWKRLKEHLIQANVFALDLLWTCSISFTFSVLTCNC